MSGDDVEMILKRVESQLETDPVSVEFTEDMTDVGDELVNLILKMTTDDLKNKNRVKFDACVRLLVELSLRAYPDSMYLELLTVVETGDDDQFLIALPCVQNCLLRMSEKKNCRRVDWCCTAILTHLTENHFNAEVYFALINFFQSLTQKPIPDLEWRETIFSTIVKLFGRPLAVEDLDLKNRQIANSIFDLLSVFKPDFMMLLNEVNAASDELDSSPKDVAELKYTNLSLGVLFYVLFSDETKTEVISHVISLEHFLQSVLVLCEDMLSSTEPGIQLKGLKLGVFALNRVAQGTLSLKLTSFLELLTRVMIYGDDKTVRQNCVTVFNEILSKMTSKLRLVILGNARDIADDPGFLGYCVTKIKDFIRDKDPSFTGSSLKSVLLSYFKLASDNLQRDSDLVISLLNLLRFLFLAQPDLSAEILPQIQTSFLSPLRQLINFSISNFNNLKEDVGRKLDLPQTEISVGNGLLDEMTPEDQIKMLQNGITTFELVDTLLCRVLELSETLEKLNK